MERSEIFGPHRQDTHKGCLYTAETRDVEAPLVGVLVPRATNLGGGRKFGAIDVSGRSLFGIIRLVTQHVIEYKWCGHRIRLTPSPLKTYGKRLPRCYCRVIIKISNSN
jgi:hypothetical protein